VKRYVALYRKWRPQTFSDVVGQGHVVRTLQNALRTGRISHAYLFAGPRGTGKTSVAKIMAKAVNCERGVTPEPCNECIICREISSGGSLDVIEIDAASNRGIDEIRDLREKVRYLPNRCRQKVYIIDEVHMLTPEAFNALLKTLEEPPSHVMFIMATTEPQRIPLTILSRCQRFDFRRLSTRDIVKRLHQVAVSCGYSVAEDARWLIARHAEGSLRDALSILDQCAAYEEEITASLVLDLLGRIPIEELHKTVKAVMRAQPAATLRLVDEALAQGKEAVQIAQDLIDYLREAVLVLSGASEVSSLTREQRHLIAADFSLRRTVQLLEALSQCLRDMKWSPDPRVDLELALLQVAMQGDDAPTPECEEAAMTASAPDDAQGRDQEARGQLDLRSEWPRLKAKLREMLRRTTFAYLEECVPLDLRGDRLRLGFRYVAHVEGLSAPGHLRALEEALEKLLRRRVRVECVRLSTDEETEEPQESFTSRQEEVVQRALELFGGMVVDDRPPQGDAGGE